MWACTLNLQSTRARAPSNPPPDLATNIWTNTGEIPDNGVDDDDNGFIDDYHGVNILELNGCVRAVLCVCVCVCVCVF